MPPEVSLKQLFKLSEEQKDSIAVLICDYRQFNRLKHMSYGNFLNKGNKYHNFVYLDISLPENREAQYIFSFDHLPAIVVLDDKGKVCGIEDYMHKQEFDKNEVKYYSSLLHGYISLVSNAPDTTLFREIISDSLLMRSFYVNTLIARYYDAIHQPQNAQQNWQKAVSLFEDNPDKITERLYVASLNRLNDTLFHIIAWPLYVDLGEFDRQMDTTTCVLLSNYSQRVYHLLDIRTSCSCIKVHAPRIIKPGQTDTLIIHYSVGKEPGPFEYEVQINPLLHKNKFNIIIKGFTNERY